MKLFVTALGFLGLLIPACGSATSVDAQYQELCDKQAACLGNATADQVKKCKEQAVGYDKLFKTECVSPYARYYDCAVGQVTCTNRTIDLNDKKVATACKTQAEEAAKCQTPPSGFVGGGVTSSTGATSVDAVLQTFCDIDATCTGASSSQVAQCKSASTGYDKQLKASCVAPYARYYDCRLRLALCVDGQMTLDSAKADSACQTQADEAVKCQAPPASFTNGGEGS